MGTNYYLHEPPTNKCEHCGRQDEKEPLHIGKSSVGWVFALHIIPEMGIEDLEDWIPLFNSGASMTMEYWDSSHDTLAGVVLDAERYNRLKAIATLGFSAAPSWDAVLRIPIKDASHNTLDKIIDSHDPKES